MPITVIVEDGSLVANANSYVAVADADAQIALDPFSAAAWAALTSDQKAGLVIKASSLLDAKMAWRGNRVTNDQSLLWPRHGAVDDDGYAYEDDEIPVVLPKATAIFAANLGVSLVAGDNPESAQNDLRGLNRLKVDTIELGIDKYDRPTVVSPTVIEMLATIAGSKEKSGGTAKLVRT